NPGLGPGPAWLDRTSLPSGRKRPDRAMFRGSVWSHNGLSLTRPRCVRAPRRACLRHVADGSRMTTTKAKRTTWHLRLWLGLAVAAGVLFAPRLSRGEVLTLSAAALAYVLGATIFDAVAARRPRFPARMFTPLLGVAVIELVIIAIPRALAAGLVLFLLVVTFSTYVGGLRLGLYLSSAAGVGALVADLLAPEAERVDGGTLVAFAVVVPLVAVVTARLTAERRRTAVALVRLHDALETAEAQPDLETTLDSIATSARHAVRAAVAGIVLRDRDHVIFSAWMPGPTGPTPAQPRRMTAPPAARGPASP